METSTTITTDGYVVKGEQVHESNQTIEQDAGRTTPLVNLTVMAYDNTSSKQVPLTDVSTILAATDGDGTNMPSGLYLGQDITAAELVAGDVTGKSILVGKTVEIDEDAITLENSLTLESVVVATGRTIRKELQALGIYIRSTAFFQNAQPIA